MKKVVKQAVKEAVKEAVHDAQDALDVKDAKDVKEASKPEPSTAWPRCSSPSARGRSRAAQELALPAAPTSVKFAVIGDSGTGDPEQYQVADQMTRFHAKFAFDRVIMLGDNIYGGQAPQDLVKKFSQPYKALLDAGVKFYASLGNHDSPDNRLYPLFNMGGERYYSLRDEERPVLRARQRPDRSEAARLARRTP